MQFSLEELTNLSERAMSLTDRLENKDKRNKKSSKSFLFKQKMERWCQVAAQEDWDKFKKRLAWDGLSIEMAHQVFEPIFVDNQELPTWCQTLNEYLRLLNVEGETSIQKFFLDNPKKLPFKEIFIPFIYLAKKRLNSTINSCPNLFSEAAFINLEENLLELLIYLSKRALDYEFDIFCNSRYSSLEMRLRKTEEKYSDKYYQYFIKSICQGGILDFFKQYPVLARLVTTIIDFWVDNTIELILRLSSDHEQIWRTFQPDSELGQVIEIKSDLSDHHNKGHFVVTLKFQSGFKLVYKPRNLGIEQAYNYLLNWFNQQDINLHFKSFKVLNQINYGWAEFIETAPCESDAQYQQYYQRIGMLLCLTYVLGSTDLHGENIISCGVHPVIVDLETLMHPWVREEQELAKAKGTQFLAEQKFLHSVMRTALLPQWEIGLGGEVYDISALGKISKRKKERIFKSPIDISQESQNPEIESKSEKSRNSIRAEIEKYCPSIITGFQYFYHFLMNKKQTLLNDDSPLKELGFQPIRFVYRSTKFYTALLNYTLRPDFLQDGVERSIQIDILCRSLLLQDSKPLSWSLLEIERQALEQMDIPLFTARPNSTSLFTAENEAINNYFTEPSFNLVLKCVEQLNEKDLEDQLSFIKGSIYSRITDDIHPSVDFDGYQFLINKKEYLNEKILLEQSIFIAEDLQKRAIPANGSSLTWIAPQYLLEANRFQFQPIRYNLFDGSCGLALFFAALHKVNPNLGYDNLVISICDSLNILFQESQSNHIHKSIGIGGALGYGSIVYALVHISQFINQPNILEKAQDIACLITPELICSDKKLDIVEGTAGAILGLLTLYNISGNSTILEQAKACGNHLLNNRIVANLGYRSWPTLNGKFFTGFSHGAAGIAYALIRLYQKTDEIAFLEAAQEGIAYEQSIFDFKIGNWPKFKIYSPQETPLFMCSWCHGAPGIGLARVSTLNIINSPKIYQDIEVAINMTKKQKISVIDPLCCGNLGRVEFLFTAGQKLSQPKLIEAAMKRVAQIVARAQQRNSFCYDTFLIYKPGFFQGASGIGYQLLRLAYPDQLPSVLLWE